MSQQYFHIISHHMSVMDVKGIHEFNQIWCDFCKHLIAQQYFIIYAHVLQFLLNLNFFLS